MDNNGICPQYPTNLYVTGFGIGENESQADRRQLAKQNTRTDLSSKFIVRIQSRLVSQEVEISGKYNSEFRNTVSSQTQLNLINVNVVHRDDARRKQNYALAVMNIETAIRNYSSRFDEVLKQIAALIQEKIKTISNAAVSIAEQLHSQLETSVQLALFPVTYRDTDFSSQFSAHFLPLLEKELITYYKVISHDTSNSHISPINSQNIFYP